VYGLRLSGASNNTFINNTVYNNTQHGFYIYSSANNTFTINTVYSNLRSGFVLDVYSNTTTFTGNTAYNNSEAGFYLYASSSNNLTNNTAYNNTLYGFAFTSISNNNTLINNIAYNNTNYDFLLSTSSNNTLTNNTGYSSTVGFGLLTSSNNNTLTNNTAYSIINYGFHILSSYNNTLINNSAYNDLYGIYIQTASNNTLTNNTAHNNQLGIYLYSSTNNNVTNNTAYNDSTCGFYISISSNNNFTNNSAYNNSQYGFYLLSSSNNTLASNNASNNTYGFWLDGSQGNNITDSFAQENSQFDLYNNLATGASASFCNNTVSNLTGSGGRPIFYSSVPVSVSGLVLSELILCGAGGSSVTNTTVMGSDTLQNNGFIMIDTNDTNVSDSSSPGNYYGFFMTSSYGNRFTDDTAYNNSQYGFYLYLNNYSILTNNSAYNNIYDGFLIYSSSNNILINNTAYNNNDTGFYLYLNNYSILTSNTAYNNSYHGFLLYTSSNSILTSNTAYNNSDGFYLAVNASNNTLINNTAYNNSDGFYLAVNASNNTLINNTAYNNSDGFYLNSSSNNTLASNTAYNNSDGFYLNSSSNNTLASNTAYNNSDGFYLLTSSDNNLTGNIAYGNLISGIYLESSNNTRLSYEHCYDNTADLMVNGTFNVSFTNVIFDSPSGSFQNYTNLSLTDTVDAGEAYSITWSANPSALPVPHASFAGKFVNITMVSGSLSMDILTLHWLDSESALYNESKFQLWKYNSSGWELRNYTPDTAANTFSYPDLSSSSDLAILRTLPVPGGGNANHGESHSLIVSESGTCDTLNVTVSFDASPAEGATIEIRSGASMVASRTTGPDGSAVFALGNGTYDIVAYYSGLRASGSFSSMSCMGCAADPDCAANERCMDGRCAMIECPGGQVISHQCQTQNQSQSKNSSCSPPACCTASSQCADNQVCQAVSSGAIPGRGSCKPVSGQCGRAVNHTFVPYGYKCGSEAGCPACPSGIQCINHECVQFNITCSSPDTVGSTKTCNVTRNGLACRNCAYKVVSPDGTASTGKTDGSGSFSLLLNIKGNYSVSLLENNSVVKSIRVDAVTPPAGGQQNTDAGSTDGQHDAAGGSGLLPVIGLLIVLIAAAAIYWVRRPGKKK